jgi:ribosomal protein L11 methyltransferase
MPWVELHIKTSDAHANPLGDQLSLLGAEAVSFQDAGDQPIYEPAPGAFELWQETIVIGLFNQTTVLNPILAYLEQQQATGLIKSFKIQDVPDQDWERTCLEHFKPIPIGQRLWICPSWLTPPDPLAVNVILDPGLAFGTGTHPTTALCLAWLEKNISSPLHVIDYGCGSGILALAALKLGAKNVWAVDSDPQALDATQRNAERNPDIADKLTTFLPGQLEKRPEKANLLIANILAQPLLALVEKFAELTHENGQILLSGIMPEQISEIKQAYTPWFRLSEETIDTTGQWVCLSGKRFTQPKS